jgi:hypothetical protein
MKKKPSGEGLAENTGAGRRIAALRRLVPTRGANTFYLFK